MNEITAVKLGLKRDRSDLWELPVEPLVSVSGSNKIVTRDIAKNRLYGSVKELWARGDYRVTIQGIFIGAGQYPTEDVERLERLLTADRSLMIDCLLTNTVGVQLIAVESWDFPETPGLENQRYTINALSDFDFELI